MNIINFSEDGTGRFLAREMLTANSDALFVPISSNTMSVILAVTTGKAKVQYSLSSEANIRADNAIWHDWSLGEISVGKEGGLPFYSVVAYLRVVVNASANDYTLECLI
jgi:hypothetical protein